MYVNDNDDSPHRKEHCTMSLAKECNMSVDISAKQNLPQSRTKFVGSILSPAWCDTEMGVGGEYSHRSEHLSRFRQSICTHKQ
jgi:hypothetical protein